MRVRQPIRVLLAACYAIGSVLSTGCDRVPPNAPPPTSGPIIEGGDWAYDMSDDGGFVIYRHRPSQEGVGGVYMLNLRNSSPPVLVFADSLPYFASDCRFSPDGTKIAYTRNFLEDIWVLNLADASQTQVTFTGGNARNPDWDPSGRFVVYSRNSLPYGMPDSTAGIHIVDTEDLSDRSFRVGGKPMFGDLPRWSPDSTLIAFSLLTWVTTQRMYSHIFAAEVDGSKVSDVTFGARRRNEWPDWNQDEILFESRGSSPFDHVTQGVRSDGSGLRTLPMDIHPYIGYSAVARIARQVVYTYPDSGGHWGVLFLRNLDDGTGSSIRQLTTFLPIPDAAQNDGTGLPNQASAGGPSLSSEEARSRGEYARSGGAYPWKY